MRGNPRAVDALPYPGSTDKEEWDFLILCLEARVLWNNDREEEKGLDVPPEDSRRLKEQLGIADDYYVAVPPDPSEEQAEFLLEELRRLTPEGALFHRFLR